MNRTKSGNDILILKSDPPCPVLLAQIMERVIYSMPLSRSDKDECPGQGPPVLVLTFEMFHSLKFNHWLWTDNSTWAPTICTRICRIEVSSFSRSELCEFALIEESLDRFWSKNAKRQARWTPPCLFTMGSHGNGRTAQTTKLSNKNIEIFAKTGLTNLKLRRVPYNKAEITTCYFVLLC